MKPTWSNFQRRTARKYQKLERKMRPATKAALTRLTKAITARNFAVTNEMVDTTHKKFERTRAALVRAIARENPLRGMPDGRLYEAIRKGRFALNGDYRIRTGVANAEHDALARLVELLTP